MAKKIEPKCKNCRLFDPVNSICKVAILVNGEKYNLPVSPDDYCHLDELGIPVQEVRFWVEDPATGKPTDGNGVVKVQYPEGFFGTQGLEPDRP